MAQIFEVRRHSLRGEGDCLSPQGVEAARKATATLVGNYAAIYSSPKRRAVETLEAFGFREYQIVPEFSTLPAALGAHDRHAAMLRERSSCTLLEAYFAIPATHLMLEAFGAAFFAKLCSLIEQLPPNRNALAVSHGGSIEAAVLAAVPEWTLGDLGGELAECEGALFHFDDRIFRRVTFIRR
ncbi:MAG TPA: histidine phosphatase family protein [Planctomycetota bacterium]|nr:histidine phosphatase family protein [Planctomycetota bacterium]HRR81641.1 histidine phosphatase family protein [Planctomycetota bacterium]HRT93691.1 histidine phosphatase family protein [Planctomycetota bacterium]